MKNSTFLILTFFCSIGVFSQDIFMQNGTFNQCSGTLYDSGGSSGNYSSNENYVLTICPENPGQTIQLEFTAFNTQLNADILTIYNGDSTAEPVFGSYSGGGVNNNPGFVSATQDNTTGCITLEFISDGAGTGSGWAATISCMTPCQTINSQIDSATPAPNNLGYIRVCPNETITLQGSATFSVDGTGATYEWDLGDGNTIAGQTATFSYPDPGVYIVNLNVRDSNTSVDPLGCDNNNLINQVIQVATEPDFTGTQPADINLCYGETTTIPGVVNPVEFINSCTPPVSGVTFLPDGNGVSYETSVTVDCYESSMTLTDINQLMSICVTMEHSYLGDLDIEIISPNGQTVRMHDQGGGSANLGIPWATGAVDGQSGNTTPGIGAQYCFVPGNAYPTLVGGIVAGGVFPSGNGPGTYTDTYVPAGNYSSYAPLTGLLGSPLNGVWTLRIVDNIGLDNGYVFAWSIEFDPNLQPPELSFTPVITSEGWDPDPTISATNGNVITVAPTVAGQYCYTYRVTDDFGCEYTKEVCITMEPELFGDVSAVSDNLCTGGDAEFVITGVPNAEATYQINGGPPQTVVLDGNGEAIVTIVAPPVDQTLVLTNILTINSPITGNAIIATGGANPENAIGPIEANGTAPNNTNSAKIESGATSLTLTLGHIVPAGTVITISAAKNNTNSNMTVTDGTNTNNINTGALNVLTYHTFTLGADTDQLIFTRVTGDFWIDGVVYTFTPYGCDLALNESATVYIGQIYDTSFTLQPSCTGATATITGDIGGIFAFDDPQPTDGAVIDPTTGSITNGTEGTTYSVIYSFPGNCGPNLTQSVTTLAPDDSSFSLTSTCDGAVASITGLGGGTFSFNPVPTDGATIDPVTGTVTGGFSGTTYTIVYTTNGNCPTSTSHSFDPISPDDGSFSLTPTCDGATATVTGLAGGVFGFDPVPTDGAMIDPSTGTITGGTHGTTYTIRYTTNGSCPVSNTLSVTVLSLDDGAFTLTPTCDGATATVTGLGGGTFAFDPDPMDGAIINATTGTVTGGVSGATYIISYTTSGVCPVTVTNSVTVLPSEDASFVVTPTCDGGTVNITGDPNGTFAFSPAPSDGAVIDPVTGEVTGGTPGATYTISYTTVGNCPDMITQQFTVLSADDSSFTIIPTCDGATITVTGLGGGTFEFDPVPSDGAVIDPVFGTVTGASPGATYTVSYSTNGNCPTTTQNSFTVYSQPVVFDPTPLVVCDDNVPDGLTEINLSVKDNEITGGVSSYIVTYHLTVVDAQSGTAQLPIPYTNISNPQTVHVRVEDSNTGCFDLTELVLQVEQAPVAFVPTPLQYCDPDNDGYGVFNLADAETQVTGGDPNLSVTFHETEVNAEAGVNALPLTYANIVIHVQTIYVRVVNATLTSGCATIVPLVLEVLPTPVLPDDISDYTVCDADSDGFAIFDLRTKDTEIYGNQSSTDYVLTYHTSLSDAESGLSPIINVGNYTNLSNPQTIYVRLEGTNGCYKTGDFDLVVNLPPVVYQPTELEQCDDDVADERTVFDLTVKNFEITGGDGSLMVSYYENLANAQSGTGAIDPATSYTNLTNPQTLFVRVDDADTGCASFVLLTIRVQPNPTPGLDPQDIILCDDINAGDGYETFDLTINETYIVNGEAGVVVTYHENQYDAETGQNPIADPANYQNLLNDFQPQTIYVRVTNATTGCYSLVDFDIQVNPLPQAVAISDYLICEVITDGFAQFDLTSKNDEVLGGQDPSLYTVTYHATQAGADNLTGALLSPYTNTTNPQQIFVAITDVVTGCSVSTASFYLRVYDGAESNPDGAYIELVECDYLGDNDGLAQFDLTQANADVLDYQDPAHFTVTYYLTLEAAEEGTDPLPYIYENISNPQIVYVRVDNDTPDATGADGSICYAVSEISLRVDLLPEIGLEDSYTLCVDNNGTEAIGLPYLDTGLSTSDHTFEWSLDGSVLSGEVDSVLVATQAGTYSVLVINTTTGCQSQASAEVVTSTPPQIVVEVATEGFSSNAVIVAQATGDGDYEYSLDGGPWQDSGTFEGVSYGEHTVTARDKNGCGTAEGTVTVLDYPHFFTPNGDGRHDTWNIVGLSDQSGATIHIFDRYGKLLKQISPSGQGWDGTYNGQLMPSSDYWFVVEYNEPSTGQRKQFKAHFALKR